MGIKHMPSLFDTFSRYLFSPFILFALLMSGCVPAVHNISVDTKLREEEGILITKVRTNVRHSAIFFQRKESDDPDFKLEGIDAIEDVRVIKIGKGDFLLSKVERGRTFILSDCGYFSIEPQAINYIGDLVVEWTAERGGIFANILMIDREADTLSEAEEHYPWIFTQYPYRKSIATCK